MRPWLLQAAVLGREASFEGADEYRSQIEADVRTVGGRSLVLRRGPAGLVSIGAVDSDPSQRLQMSVFFE